MHRKKYRIMLKCIKSGFYNLIFLHFTVAKSFYSQHCCLFLLILISISDGSSMELLILVIPVGEEFSYSPGNTRKLWPIFAEGGRNPSPCSNQKSCCHQSSFFFSISTRNIHISLDLEGPGRGDFPSNKTNFSF